MNDLCQQGLIFARFVLFAETQQAETTIATEGVQPRGCIFVIVQPGIPPSTW
jgi:hypothetical protein